MGHYSADRRHRFDDLGYGSVSHGDKIEVGICHQTVETIDRLGCDFRSQTQGMG
jgi:hypothetical protein